MPLSVGAAPWTGIASSEGLRAQKLREQYRGGPPNTSSVQLIPLGMTRGLRFMQATQKILVQVVNKAQGYAGRKRRKGKLYYLKDKPVALYQVKYKDSEGRVGLGTKI